MNAAALEHFIDNHPRLFVLTGAGCSTDSGIPDYRDVDGGWKQAQPLTLQAFTGDPAMRQRYWARSLVGWRRIGHAQPNAAHRALAALEHRGGVEVVLTQNVDRLHQAAGSRHVIDLHGRIDVVRCLGCEQRLPREELQDALLQANPDWAALDAAPAPDGDARLHAIDFSRFVVLPCARCGGMLKPDVVFFGENVPKQRGIDAQQHLERADAMLVVGSSLMVFSGFRFVQAAARAGLPIAAVNLGRTRADSLISLKIEQRCAQALAFLLDDSQSQA